MDLVHTPNANDNLTPREQTEPCRSHVVGTTDEPSTSGLVRPCSIHCIVHCALHCRRALRQRRASLSHRMRTEQDLISHLAVLSNLPSHLSLDALGPPELKSAALRFGVSGSRFGQDARRQSVRIANFIKEGTAHSTPASLEQPLTFLFA